MSFKELLKDTFPDEKLSIVPAGFEVIGDIAIIDISQSLDDVKYIIAQALVSHRKDIRTVLGKVNKIDGEKRIGGFELLYGNSTETIHRENNCVFRVDVTKAYFSTKLAYERSRIASLTGNGEDVLVLFCGVGPFLIPVKKNRNVNMTGLDNNPDACSFLKNNLELNNIRADIILADANSINNLFKKTFDRMIMPTPYGQDYFLNLSGPLLKSGGMIHFYTFKKDFEIHHFKILLEDKGWKVNFYRKCGNVAPRVSRYVFDLEKVI